MATHDLQGRPYARMSNLRAGDLVVVDDGFTCIKGWSERVVQEDPDAPRDDRLWIPCTNGRVRHYLSGSLDFDETSDALIGVYLKSELTSGPVTTDAASSRSAA